MLSMTFLLLPPIYCMRRLQSDKYDLGMGNNSQYEYVQYEYVQYEYVVNMNMLLE